MKAYYGDATRMELLETAGIEEAKILVIALDDNDQAIFLAKEVKRQYPNIEIFSRAWDMAHLFALMNAGIKKPRRETFHSSLLLARDVLEQMGYGVDDAKQSATRFYEHDQEIVQALYKVEEVEERIVLSKDLRSKFEAQIEGDAQYREKNNQGLKQS